MVGDAALHPRPAVYTSTRFGPLLTPALVPPWCAPLPPDCGAYRWCRAPHPKRKILHVFLFSEMGMRVITPQLHHCELADTKPTEVADISSADPFLDGALLQTQATFVALGSPK